jgi:hypothetical protein
MMHGQKTMKLKKKIFQHECQFYPGQHIKDTPDPNAMTKGYISPTNGHLQHY